MLFAPPTRLGDQGGVGLAEVCSPPEEAGNIWEECRSLITDAAAANIAALVLGEVPAGAMWGNVPLLLRWYTWCWYCWLGRLGSSKYDASSGGMGGEECRSPESGKPVKVQDVSAP
jgi:hypothetical protein